MSDTEKYKLFMNTKYAYQSFGKMNNGVTPIYNLYRKIQGIDTDGKW